MSTFPSKKQMGNEIFTSIWWDRINFTISYFHYDITWILHFWIIKLHMVIIVFQHIFYIPSISLIMWAENPNTTHSPYNERQKFG